MITFEKRCTICTGICDPENCPLDKNLDYPTGYDDISTASILRFLAYAMILIAIILACLPL